MISAAYPHARKFILDALHLDRDLPAPAVVLEMRAEDWDCLLRTAQMHRLGPMLYHRLGGSAYADLIPRGVLEQLKAAHRKSALRSLTRYRELVTVTRLLDAEQIPSIALKGAFLARYAYPDAGLRPMRDLDLLIKQEHAVKAFELLKEHGCRPDSDGFPEAYFADRRHLPPLKGPDGSVIELHIRLIASDSYRTYSADFGDELWVRSVSRMIGGTRIRFLCIEDMMLHLCIHATLEHQFDLGPLALVDIALLVDTQQIDWPNFIRVVCDDNWQRPVLPVLHLARQYLGAKIPDEVIQTLGGKESEATWLESAEYLLFADFVNFNLPRDYVQRILIPGNLFERFVTFLGIVFPPRLAIARHFPVSADSPKAFLYYPLHWLRMFAEKLPFLLKTHAGRKGAIRQLALHRKTLSDWLEEEGS